MGAKKLEFRMPKRVSPENDARYQRHKKLMENTDVMRITVNVPTHIHNKFKVLCAKNRLQMKEAVLAMVVKYLKTKEI